MKENRRYKRVPCELPAFLTLHDPDSGTFVAETTVSDISEGGVRFRLNRFLPVGRQLMFRLSLPLKQPVETSVLPAWVAEVPRVNQYEIGASFLSLMERDRQAIREFTRIPQRA